MTRDDYRPWSTLSPEEQRHEYESYLTLMAELEEPAPYKPPCGVTGKPLPQFMAADFGIAPEGRAW